MPVNIEDLPEHAKIKVREKAKETESKSDDGLIRRKEKLKKPKEETPKRSFKEKVREKFSRVVNKVVPHKDNTQNSTKKTSGNEGKKKQGKRSKPYSSLKNLPSKRSGARYTSVLDSPIRESVVPGKFIDPFAVEHEVRGRKERSPFALSMGSSPPPYMPTGIPSPGEMMGWEKPRKRRK